MVLMFEFSQPTRTQIRTLINEKEHSHLPNSIADVAGHIRRVHRLLLQRDAGNEKDARRA